VLSVTRHRMRIVYALSGGRVRSTADLCAGLPEIPKTTVYRHVGLLADGGVLEVADEQRVRGAVERHYRLRRDRTLIEAEAGASMSLEDHRHGFTAAVAALHAEFDAYLGRPGADPYPDLVGYRQGVLWLSPDEIVEMLGELRAVFAARAGTRPQPSPDEPDPVPDRRIVSRHGHQQATTASESDAQ
jgi:hypothetical protein